MTELTINPVFLAGVIISAIAVLGLAVASVLNVRGARGPKERRFLAWCTIGLWILLGILIFLMALLGPPWRYVVLGAYFLMIPYVVYRVSMRRQLIREWESGVGARSA